jgi:hypothetical protein
MLAHVRMPIFGHNLQKWHLFIEIPLQTSYVYVLISHTHELTILTLHISEANQEKIVEAGGLTSLLMLLRSSEDETIRRVAAGAIANLAMNG